MTHENISIVNLWKKKVELIDKTQINGKKMRKNPFARKSIEKVVSIE